MAADLTATAAANDVPRRAASDAVRAADHTGAVDRFHSTGSTSVMASNVTADKIGKRGLRIESLEIEEAPKARLTA